MEQPVIRVVIVHDMEVVRAGLMSFLASYDDMRVVAQADRLTLQLTASLGSDLAPDVVIADPYRPGGGGSEAIRRLVRSCPGVRVVTIAGSRDDAAVRSAAEAGAAGCVRITVEQAALARAIREAMQGRFVFPSDVLHSPVGVRTEAIDRDSQATPGSIRPTTRAIRGRPGQSGRRRSGRRRWRPDP